MLLDEKADEGNLLNESLRILDYKYQKYQAKIDDIMGKYVMEAGATGDAMQLPQVHMAAFEHILDEIREQMGLVVCSDKQLKEGYTEL